jgi:hypothetical protein
MAVDLAPDAEPRISFEKTLDKPSAMEKYLF